MRVSATEQELLAEEINRFGAMVRDPQIREQFAELRSSVEEGDVPDELLGHLGNVLEAGLHSGRLRKLYGADGETALTRVFGRTPAGAALADEARVVSEALSALHGQRIEDIRVSALGPGSYGLMIDTDGCQISLRLDRTGVRVENVAIGI